MRKPLIIAPFFPPRMVCFNPRHFRGPTVPVEMMTSYIHHHVRLVCLCFSHDRSERTRSRSRSRERHRRFEITHLALSEVYLSLSLVEGVQEMGVSTIVITEEGVDHEREGVPTAVKADAIHDLPAGIAQNSPTKLSFFN